MIDLKITLFIFIFAQTLALVRGAAYSGIESTGTAEWDQCCLTFDIGSFLEGVAVITNIGLNTKESNLYIAQDRVHQACNIGQVFEQSNKIRGVNLITIIDEVCM